MKRIAVVIALLCATSAGADALQEWKTPAGKIYFGDHPPEGSVAVKRVQKPLGKVAVQNPARPGRIECRRSCRGCEGIGQRTCGEDSSLDHRTRRDRRSRLREKIRRGARAH